MKWALIIFVFVIMCNICMAYSVVETFKSGNTIVQQPADAVAPVNDTIMNNMLTAACNESWIPQFSECTTNISIKSYYDENECNTTFILPADNGIQIICDPEFNFNLFYMIGLSIAVLVVITIIIVCILV